MHGVYGGNGGNVTQSGTSWGGFATGLLLVGNVTKLVVQSSIISFNFSFFLLYSFLFSLIEFRWNTSLEEMAEMSSTVNST